MYPELMVIPMREELVRAGIKETRSAEDVDSAISQPGTTLLVVNSICGCAAGKMRPGVRLALGNSANLPDHKMALKYYRLRMWCEEMHGDFKKHGFDLESTMLRDFLRLSRLTLAVALLYVWLISVGGRTIHQGLRHLVDRHDRRDLSIFQIGLRFIQRRLTNALPVSVPLCTYL